MYKLILNLSNIFPVIFAPHTNESSKQFVEAKVKQMTEKRSQKSIKNLTLFMIIMMKRFSFTLLLFHFNYFTHSIILLIKRRIVQFFARKHLLLKSFLLNNIFVYFHLILLLNFKFLFQIPSNYVQMILITDFCMV